MSYSPWAGPWSRFLEIRWIQLYIRPCHRLAAVGNLSKSHLESKFGPELFLPICSYQLYHIQNKRSFTASVVFFHRAIKNRKWLGKSFWARLPKAQHGVRRRQSWKRYFCLNLLELLFRAGTDFVPYVVQHLPRAPNSTYPGPPTNRNSGPPLRAELQCTYGSCYSKYIMVFYWKEVETLGSPALWGPNTFSRAFLFLFSFSPLFYSSFSFFLFFSFSLHFLPFFKAHQATEH